MKRFIGALIILVAVVTAFIADCSAKNGCLTLVLQADETGFEGSIASAIITVRNTVYFFDHNGKMVKKIQVIDSNDVRVSSNHGFAAIASQTAHRLTLYNSSGQRIWVKESPEQAIGPQAVADDGQRVIALCVTEEADPTLKYLDGSGKELLSLAGYDLVGLSQAVSSDCRFWVCGEYGFPPMKWLFLDGNGKKVRELSSQPAIFSMSNNGHYLDMHADEGSDIFEEHDFSGRAVGRHKRAIQSKKGDLIFSVDGLDYVFETKNGKSKIRGNLPKEAYLWDIAPDGDFALFKATYGKATPCKFFFVFRDGTVLSEILNPKDFRNMSAAEAQLFDQQKHYLLIWDEFQAKCHVYVIER